MGFKLNVPVRDDAETVFDECDADVAIIAIASLMTDMEEHFDRAARYGVNAISTCEEALLPVDHVSGHHQQAGQDRQGERLHR